MSETFYVSVRIRGTFLSEKEVYLCHVVECP